MTLQVSTNRKKANESEVLDVARLGASVGAAPDGRPHGSRCFEQSAVCLPGIEDYRGCLTIWRVEVQGGKDFGSNVAF